MVTALEALDLDELSDGRFVLGLGTGVQRLNEDWHNARVGQAGRPTCARRSATSAPSGQAARRGEPIELEGEYEPMRIRGYRRPYPVLRPEIPIYLAAMGPALTRLAGEIADGWISHELSSPEHLRAQILPELEAGLARGRPDPRRRRRGHLGVLLGRRRPGGRAAPYGGHGRLLRQRAHLRRLLRLPRPGRRAGRRSSRPSAAAAARALSPTPSPDPMVDALTLSGTRDEVAARIAAYDGLADTIKLTPPTHGLSAAEIRIAQKEVIAVIAELTGAAR